MKYCPVCKSEWEDSVTECPVCSQDLTPPEMNGEPVWVLLGYIKDKMSADYAVEVLRSYDVPAVVISKSGFFGAAGLTLTSFYKPGAQLFELSVPQDFLPEATDLVNMALGDNWTKKD